MRTTWQAQVIGLLTALVAALTPSTGRAGSCEAGIDFGIATMEAAVTLGVAGSAAVGFDIASAVYLARGRNRRAGRIVVGIGSMMSGTGLVVGSTFSLLNIQREDTDFCKEGAFVARDQARALAVTDLVLAGASIGIGVAAVATYGAPKGAALSVNLLRVEPFAVGSGGAGLRFVGEF